jgi:hypothetical protein
MFSLRCYTSRSNAGFTLLAVVTATVVWSACDRQTPEADRSPTAPSPTAPSPTAAASRATPPGSRFQASRTSASTTAAIAIGYSVYSFECSIPTGQQSWGCAVGCAPGDHILGGGVNLQNNDDLTIKASYPDPIYQNSWQSLVTRPTANNAENFEVVAICANVS